MRPIPALAVALAILSVPALSQDVDVAALPIPIDGSEVDVRVQAIELVESGRTIYDVRRVLPDGTVARTGFDEDGVLVDVDAARRADHALGMERRGNLAPTLFDAVAGLGAGETIEVAFWLVEPADGIDHGAELRASVRGVPAEGMPDAVDAAKRAALERAVERYAPGNATFVEAVEAAGAEVVETAGAWPVVFVRGGAETIRALALHPLVDEAYRSMPVWAPEGDFAQGTLRSSRVHDQGVTGAGSPVQVLVNDTGQVDLNHPDLPPVVPLESDFEGSHGTGVAGNICNTHSQYFAAAFGLPAIYTDAGTGDSGAPAVWQNAIQQGIDIGNCSWWNFLKGQIEFLDRFFDHTIRNFSVMMFKSTGNQGFTGTPYTTTPGNGYNVTNSGNYSDLNTVDWPGDVMASSSSYWDPIEGHEKPELASPGDGVLTTTTGGGLQNFGGTSSASPLTAGVAALLLTADGTLLGQMSTLKAALMASAWHNVEGAPLISEKDGAGGVHAAAAYGVVRDQQWWYQEVVDSDFVGGVIDVPVDLDGGDETRIVALWHSNANAAYTTDVLDMDLDVTVLAPDQSVVASSSNAFNAFEIVGFVPPVTGTYTVRLDQIRFDGTSEPLSVVWSTRQDTATATVSMVSGSFSVGSTATFEFREPFIGAGEPFIAWGAGDPAPESGILGGGYVLPTAADGLAFAIKAMPGWTSVLGAGGIAQANLPVPNNPALVGMPVHFAMLVFDGAIGSGNVSAVSDVTTLVIGS